MLKNKLRLAALAIALALPALQGCIEAAVIGGVAATGVISAHDRRSTGTQADDETTEWKGGNRIPEQYQKLSHINFTSYNHILLMTGEVPSEEAKLAIGEIAGKIEGIRLVHNELGVGPISSLGSRSNDSYIDSKVKARLVDSNQVSANHIKVVTERAIVHLMGIVNAREAKVAVDVARTTAGVKKVINLLEVLGDEEIRNIDNRMLGARNPPPASAPVEKR